MAVPVKQAIPITFSGGLDTKSDPKQIAPTDFLELNNMVFSKGGSLVKRNGFETLGTTIAAPKNAISWASFNKTGSGTLSDVRKVFTYNNELLINDAWNLFSYDSALKNWVYKGRSTMVRLSTSSVLQNTNTYSSSNSIVDYKGQTRFIAYTKQEGNFPALTYTLYYSIQDVETGQFIVQEQKVVTVATGKIKPTFVSTANFPSLNSLTYLFYETTTTGEVGYLKFINQNVQNFGVPQLLTNDISLVEPYVDIHQSSNGSIYLARVNAAGFLAITKYDINLNAVGGYVSGTEQPKYGITWFDDGTNIWVAYGTPLAVKTLVIVSDLSGLAAGPFTVDNTTTPGFINNITGVWSTTNNCAFIFWDNLILDVNGNTTLSKIYYANITIGGAVGIHDVLLMNNVTINGRAFTLGGIPHLMAHYSQVALIQNGLAVYYSSIQPTDFLLNVYNVTENMGVANNYDVPANIAAKVSADQSNPFAPTKNHLNSFYETSSNVIEASLLRNSNYGTENALQSPIYAPTGVIMAQFDFNLSNPDVQVLGNNALISSGTLLMYDGYNVCEHNFHIYPNTPTYSISNVGGGMGLAGGTSLYSYIITYEWIDNQGQVHRSFTSPVATAYALPNSYTFAAGIVNGKITLTIPTLSLTNKPATDVVVNVYRTLANKSIYYLVGKTYTSVSTYGTAANDPYTTFVTPAFEDTYSDADIQENVQLYTTGALGYYAVPAPKSITNFKSRAIVVPAEESTSFLYSNQTVPYFPVSFVPEFVQNANTVGGKIEAVCYMDDKLIIFKSGKEPGPSILFMVGQGPAPSGANSDFVDPLPVSVDVGCIERTSITQSPVGLIFKSNKGIFLLDRSLQTTYIGAAVEKYNNNVVISGQLIPNTTQVRFILNDGTMLMFDYFYKRWATFTTPAAVSDCIWQGEHTFVTSSGQVYKEKPNTFADGSTPVYMSFKTAWIKLANLQNYQRAYFYYLLGECQSATNLEVSTYFDFDLNPAQTNTITPNVGELLTWRIFLANQRCQAFQISLTEKNGTTGEGFNLSGLNLVAGLKNSFIPQPNAYTVG